MQPVPQAGCAYSCIHSTVIDACTLPLCHCQHTQPRVPLRSMLDLCASWFLCPPGGVPPPPSTARPSGGGVGQLLKDALIPPSDDTSTNRDTGKTADQPAEGEESSEGIIPHLSGVLPSDDALVYGGDTLAAACQPQQQRSAVKPFVLQWCCAAVEQATVFSIQKLPWQCRATWTAI